MQLQALRTGQATAASSLSQGTRGMAAARAQAPAPWVASPCPQTWPTPAGVLEATTAAAALGRRGTRLAQGMVLAASRAQASVGSRGPATRGTTAMAATPAQGMVLAQGVTASRAVAQAMVLARGLTASRAAA